MKTIAIRDSVFHNKTKSFDFLKNIIKEEFNIEYFLDYGYEGGKTDNSYLERDFDYYLYLQAFPSFSDLLKIRNKKIIFVPMFDSSVLNRYAWEYYKGFNLKIICFSRKLYDFLLGEGFDCLYVQYFLKPLDYTVSYQEKTVFFWYRGTISFDDIKNIFGNQKIDYLTIKNVPDPGYEKLKISDEDIKKYNIQFSEKFFDTHEEQYRFVAKHNIFIAPRRKEGIGMSFLEGMSLGQCVIGYNEATMNEYIEDGINGLLTDFQSELKLDNYEKIGRNSKIEYNKKYHHWLVNKPRILDYIKGDFKSVTNIKFIHYIIYGLILIRRFLLKIR